MNNQYLFLILLLSVPVFGSAHKRLNRLKCYEMHISELDRMKGDIRDPRNRQGVVRFLNNSRESFMSMYDYRGKASHPVNRKCLSLTIQADKLAHFFSD